MEDRLLEEAKQGNLLSVPALKSVCDQVVNLLQQEPNVAALPAPVAVVGDVHGQFYDMLEVFHVSGWPPYTNYLFLGDFVDRGYHSLQTIQLLVLLKLRYPSRVLLLRGNHESRSVTRVYGFYDECLARYRSDGIEVWRMFTDLFDSLPVAALVSNRVFATHGGLSPLLHSIDQIRVLHRFQEVPFEGMLTDMMWSDPDPDASGFSISKRGVGYLFGGDVVERFLQINRLDLFLRAHQLCNEGYQLLWKDSFATVWSAPNYCYRSGNLASVLELDEHLEKHFNVFSSSPETSKNHPQASTKPKSMEYFE